MEVSGYMLLVSVHIHFLPIQIGHNLGLWKVRRKRCAPISIILEAGHFLLCPANEYNYLQRQAHEYY